MFSVTLLSKATLSYFVLLLLLVFVNRGLLMFLFTYVLTIVVFVFWGCLTCGVGVMIDMISCVECFYSFLFQQ